uniref:Phospholipase/carboxylesterase/thioesterase domain-containing protein n=1 Tax=Glycine max TaxID=3847 RepID=I1MR14_SOYBN
MKLIKGSVVLTITITLSSAILLLLLFPQNQKPSSSSMSRARSFVLWLHGLGDSGPANEPIKTLFTSSQFRDTKWSFPSAPSAPVTCNYGSVMPSWFDILEIPVAADSPNDESSLLKAVRNVHATIDKEIAAGINPNNIFICGFSQGGALTLASVLLYPKTLGGGAVFSGWVPFNSSIIEQITPEAKQAYPGLGHTINNEELLYLESWIKARLQSSSQ